MTAIDELRRMLDERGVEWKAKAFYFMDVGTVFSTSSDFEWIAIWDKNANNLSITNYKNGLTPAQAIAATLGAADTKPDIADTKPNIADMSANVREVKVTTKPNMWGFDDYFCGHCGRRLTSVANGLNEHFPVYCEDCGTKAVY